MPNKAVAIRQERRCVGVWLRLYDTLWGLVLTYLTFALPYSIIMMNGYLDTIPKDFDEAVTIDGCTPVGILFRVLLPMAMPGLISTAVYTFLLSWNEFLFALALTRSAEVRTVPVGISMLVGEFGLKWDEMMAFSVLGSLHPRPSPANTPPPTRPFSPASRL